MLYDILVSFIGAFLGFAFALLSEAIVEKLVRRRDINSYLKNIKQELQVIKAVLESHKDSKDMELFFDVPIWEAFISSGDIRYLLNKTYYTELLNVYTKIKKANELESLNNDDSYDDSIVKKRNEVYASIVFLFSDQEFQKIKLDIQ